VAALQWVCRSLQRRATVRLLLMIKRPPASAPGTKVPAIRQSLSTRPTKATAMREEEPVIKKTPKGAAARRSGGSTPRGMNMGGAAMKTKGYAKGGAAMKTKGAAKGGVRKPSSRRVVYTGADSGLSSEQYPALQVLGSQRIHA
jgi:hypothetical protein